MLKRKIMIAACVIWGLVAVGLLLCLPRRDGIQAGEIPQEFSISEVDNYIEYQTADECSAYASAYVMRHLGRQIEGAELYSDVQRVFGFASVNSVVGLFRDYGYTAEAYCGDVDTMKQRLTSGVPIIAFICIPGDTHYVVIVGYDEDSVYLADSIAENSNADGGWYNRKLSTEEFEELWRTNLYPVKNIYIVISPQ